MLVIDNKTLLDISTKIDTKYMKVFIHVHIHTHTPFIHTRPHLFIYVYFLFFFLSELFYFGQNL